MRGGKIEDLLDAGTTMAREAFPERRPFFLYVTPNQARAFRAHGFSLDVPLTDEQRTNLEMPLSDGASSITIVETKPPRVRHVFAPPTEPRNRAERRARAAERRRKP